MIDIHERIQSLTVFQDLSKELGYQQDAQSVEAQIAQLKQLLQDQEERKITDDQFLKPPPQAIIPSPLLQPIADAESQARTRELERLETKEEPETELEEVQAGRSGAKPEEAETKSEGELFKDSENSETSDASDKES